jgi:hypothetical protein
MESNVGCFAAIQHPAQGVTAVWAIIVQKRRYIPQPNRSEAHRGLLMVTPLKLREERIEALRHLARTQSGMRGFQVRPDSVFRAVGTISIVSKIPAPFSS